MFTMTLLAAAAVVSASPAVPVRVETPEGWYQIEAESGEAEDSEIAITWTIEEPSSIAAGGEPEPVAPLSESEQPVASAAPSVTALPRIDCEEARGRYLERVLELYGVDTFSLNPRALAAWTHAWPQAGGAYDFPGLAAGILADPALAPLYGAPPVPPGFLSFDFVLQGLAKDLLACQQMRPYAPPSAP
jgi:hypothetical protein